MKHIESPYRVLILGSSGALGSAFMEHFTADPRCSFVLGLHRQSSPSLDYLNESSIEDAAHTLASQEPFHLIIHTIGALHREGMMPEKKLDELTGDNLREALAVNTIGPALALKHFSKLLSKTGSSMIFLSAKVASIEKSDFGGWYAHKISKTGMNMLIKTASIEFKRTHPHLALLALYPGMVTSGFSRPFGGDRKGKTPQQSVEEMLKVLSQLSEADTGSFLAYDGSPIPW